MHPFLTHTPSKHFLSPLPSLTHEPPYVPLPASRLYPRSSPRSSKRASSAGGARFPIVGGSLTTIFLGASRSGNLHGGDDEEALISHRFSRRHAVSTASRLPSSISCICEASVLLSAPCRPFRGAGGSGGGLLIPASMTFGWVFRLVVTSVKPSASISGGDAVGLGGGTGGWDFFFLRLGFLEVGFWRDSSRR